jgi:hypothetical protein
MTPEQIDVITTGLITTWQLVGEYGPGLFAAAIAGGCWMAARRIRERRAHRHAMKARLQRAQRETARRDPADMRPGTDEQLLSQCWASWLNKPDTEREDR